MNRVLQELDRRRAALQDVDVVGVAVRERMRGVERDAVDGAGYVAGDVASGAVEGAVE